MNLLSVIILLLIVCLALAAVSYMAGHRKSGIGG